MYRLPINEETKLERRKEGRVTRGVVARLNSPIVTKARLLLRYYSEIRRKVIPLYSCITIRLYLSISVRIYP